MKGRKWSRATPARVEEAKRAVRRAFPRAVEWVSPLGWAILTRAEGGELVGRRGWCKSQGLAWLSARRALYRRRDAGESGL